MSRLVSLCSAAALLVCAAGVASVQAGHRAVTLAVIMTNDPMANQIKVYDADTHVLLQTLSTHGKGGVGGNARGVKQYDGELFAAVNNGSNTVAIYRRDGNGLRFDKLVTTTSAPVSVDFGHDHLYVAGATTVDSFVLHRHSVEWMDGTTGLELAGGGVPPEWQHGAGWRAQRATSARDAEDRSGSGHRRYRLASRRGRLPGRLPWPCPRRQARSRRLAFPCIPMAPPSSRWRIPARTGSSAMARLRRSSAPARRLPAG